MYTTLQKQGTCYIQTPAPQLSSREAMGKAPTFVSLSLSVFAMGIVLPNLQGCGDC